MKNNLRWILWILEGIFVGFGAIMPGISGGTLCVAFGMYLPIIEVISHPMDNVKKYWKMLGFFVLGGVIGFVGLSGVANWLMNISSSLVTCAFMGFIIGTIPELWQDAGEQGRGKGAYVGMTLGFVIMLAFLMVLTNYNMTAIEPNTFGFFFCGILWGLSFIVPGLSSSSLLLFFGLYQPMLDGISKIDFGVCIPLGIGMVLCVGLLSKVISMIYKKFFAIVSHIIIGIVAATVIMIYPYKELAGMNMLLPIICIIGGAAISYIFTRLCAKMKQE